jgi:hypothetical protein
MSPEADASLPDAVRAHAAACRARIPGFVARHFSLRGSARLHRAALGPDLLRAPLNVLLVGPTVLLRLAGWLCRRLGWRAAGHWLATRQLFVETDLARRMADLMLDELLAAGGPGPVLTPPVLERARHLIAEFLTARNAVAEFTAGLVALAVGLALVQALTPSAVSLGPLLAREFAQREAIEGFWLGPWAGALWYGWFPAQASWPRILATTAAVMACFALVATFTGVLTDPLLRALGVQQRRLTRLVDTLERVALGDRDASLTLPDLYLARLADLVDVTLMALRMTR